MAGNTRLRIAVVGSGISGLSAGWLLSQCHDITLYEQADRVGGHSNTVDAHVAGQTVPTDTGFIVFNRLTYPNLTALFGHLGVATQPSEMSFAASLDNGDLEYSGGGFRGLLAQKRNLLRPRFWSMLAGLRRFYRDADRDARNPDMQDLDLGAYLKRGGYGDAFRDDHLLPMASAIWSSTPNDMMAYPAMAFIRFHANHGLLKFVGRPVWETVTGGSISYVRRLIAPFCDRIKLDTAVTDVGRDDDGVHISDSRGETHRYDQVVMAMHADQSLAVLHDATSAEAKLLGTFSYQRNLAVLHSDTSFMPRRRAAWSSWNYMGHRDAERPGASLTYWMNRLQNIPESTPLFVTLNPSRPPRPGTLHHSESYDHPVFNSAVIAAQRDLWSLQGVRRTWFCGAYFGAGFHEDGLQSGLAVAEELGGVRRPWAVPEESGRITVRAANASRSDLALLA